MKKKILIALLILGIIGAAGGYYAYSEFNRTAESLASVDPDVEKSAQFLLDKCTEGEQAFNLEYLNAIAMITGTLSSIDRKGDSAIVLSLNDDALSSVVINLDMRQNLSNMPSVKSEVKLIGKITGCDVSEGDLLSGASVNLINAILK